MRLELDPARQALFDEAGRLVRDALDASEGLGVAPATRKALADAREQLALPFLLVVVGEFNAGKSALINALLGAPILEEGVTPTTSSVTILRHASELARGRRPDGIREVAAPAELLREAALVDTPGTNAVLREHEALTRDFLPRADLVLFVSSADRPYTESERAFLQAIREWGKKVVLVLNKADLLRSEADLAQVLSFVRQRAGETLGVEPEVIALSAWLAQRGRTEGDAAALERSGLAAFEARIAGLLEERERFRLKLASPLGVARRALAEAGAKVDAGLALLEGDRAALAAIEARLAGQDEGVARDFALRLSDLQRTLLDFERRGHAFFDERLRLGRFRELLERERLRRDFESEVVAALPLEVERRVGGIVDLLVEADLRQWQDVMALLAERPAAGRGSATRVDERFAWDRARMLEEVGAAAREAVAHYDAAGEARRLAEKARESLAQAALLQVSALGLGTIVAALASTTAADVTGIVAASALSLIGLFLLPARREKARRELAAKVSALGERLMRSLTACFDAERARAAARVREAIGPYTAFVGRERERLSSASGALSALSGRLEELQRRAAACP